MPRNDSIDAFLSSRDVIKYPNPFFDLSKNYVPKNIKTLFKYCRTFFYTNEFINNVVTKLTEYPITDILFEDKIDKEAHEAYKTYFDRHLKLKDFLISIGLDYFTYGNCFISAFCRFKRNLECPECEKLFPIDSVQYKYKKGAFLAKCPNENCDSKTEINFNVVDVTIKNVNGLKFKKWNPENIEIDYDEITGEIEYFYSIPKTIKSQILTGNKKRLSTLPMVFIRAVEQDKKVKLDQNNLYHFKKPTLAEDDHGWGKPHILPAIKKLHYMATLQRGNEAIAQEHIVPKKTLFPSPSGAFDLHNLGMAKWKDKAEEAIKRWKIDPNHIAIFPIPMGYQELGGTGRSLLLTPELRFLEETIINGLGVPTEFIKGGANWTGSSVSLRIIENHFLNYRERLEDFINYFLVYKMQEFLGFKKIKIKFTRIRMNDDSEAKNIAINLNERQLISDDTLLDEFGYMSKDEKQKIKYEKEFKRDMAVNDALAQAEAQGQASLTLAKYQIKAQEAAKEQINVEGEKLFEDELQAELQADDESIYNQIKKIATFIHYLPNDADKNKALKALFEESPTTFNMVLKRLQNMQMEVELENAEFTSELLDNEKKMQSLSGKGPNPAPNKIKKVRTRNEDKSGPKRDATTGKAKV